MMDGWMDTRVDGWMDGDRVRDEKSLFREKEAAKIGKLSSVLR